MRDARGSASSQPLPSVASTRRAETTRARAAREKRTGGRSKIHGLVAGSWHVAGARGSAWQLLQHHGRQVIYEGRVCVQRWNPPPMLQQHIEAKYRICTFKESRTDSAPPNNVWPLQISKDLKHKGSRTTFPLTSNDKLLQKLSWTPSLPGSDPQQGIY